MDNAAFARYISGKSIHIELSDESKAEYLEERSSDCPDVRHIKEICRKAIGNNEKKNINAWLEKWNAQSRNGEHWLTRDMDADEVYCVLMETIIQQLLIKDARDTLLKKIDEFDVLVSRGFYCKAAAFAWDGCCAAVTTDSSLKSQKSGLIQA